MIELVLLLIAGVTTLQAIFVTRALRDLRHQINEIDKKIAPLHAQYAAKRGAEYFTIEN